MKRVKRGIALLLTLLSTLSPLAVFAGEASPSRSLSDYTGAGTVLALIGSGFDVSHPVFQQIPEKQTVRHATVTVILGLAYREAYQSAKIPFAWDYAGAGLEEDGTLGDADVSGLSDVGTALASLAAGEYRGLGDLLQPDGTVLRDADYLGVAPDAQLLLMKAAYDHSSKILGDAAGQAIRHALALSADAICIDLSATEITEELLLALRLAEKMHVPVFTGAGDAPQAVADYLATAPTVLIDRGTLSSAAELPGVVTVGAARNPFDNINYFSFGETAVTYIDTSADYLGKSFAHLLYGREYNLIPVPGEGRAEDVAGLPLAGAVALVRRGGISFVEKAKNVAAMGAVGMVVVNNEPGSSGMVLTDSPIPAVMVSTEAGESLFADPGKARLSFPEPESGIAAFSATGLSESFSHALSFLTLGQDVVVAARDGGFALRSGTVYAAASALGWYGRVAEYLSSAGLSAETGLSVLFSAAVPLYEEAGAMSPRKVGAGLLSEDSLVPVLLSENRAVTVAAGGKNTVETILRISNPTGETVTAAAVAAFFGEEVDETGHLTGNLSALPGLSVLLDGEDLTAQSAALLTLAPYETKSLSLTLTVEEDAYEALLSASPYGFYADGTVTVTPLSGGKALTLPVTACFGEREKAPLVDAFLFDGTEALLTPATLYVSSVSEGYAYPIGARDPFASETTYREEYILLHPTALKNGSFTLRVTPLRQVENTTVRVYDAEDRLVYEGERGSLPRYLTAGAQSAIRLWDFTATDGSGYVFPEGEYRCTVLFETGDSEQSITFPLWADATAPVSLSETFTTTEKGDVVLTVEAEDNLALREVSVYDLNRKYPLLSGAAAGETRATLAFDLSLCAFDSPLYIEITDYTGQYTTLRYTGEEILRILAGDGE